MSIRLSSRLLNAVKQNLDKLGVNSIGDAVEIAVLEVVKDGVKVNDTAMPDEYVKADTVTSVLITPDVYLILKAYAVANKVKVSHAIATALYNYLHRRGVL